MTTALDCQSRFSVLAAVCGCAGAVAVFLPFVQHVSAASTLATLPFVRPPRDPNGMNIFTNLDELWRLGTPMLITFLMAIASVRWLRCGASSKLERALDYVACIGAAGIVSSSLPFMGEAWAFYGLAGLVLAAGGWLWLRNRRAGMPAALNAILAMETVFVAYAALVLLIGLNDGWQTGAYTVLAVAIGCVVHVAAASTSGYRGIGTSGHLRP